MLGKTGFNVKSPLCTYIILQDLKADTALRRFELSLSFDVYVYIVYIFDSVSNTENPPSKKLCNEMGFVQKVTIYWYEIGQVEQALLFWC